MIENSRRTFLKGAAGGVALAAASGASAGHTSAASHFGPDEGSAWLIYNENPYGPAPSALRAVAESASKGAYYPGSALAHLREMIAERHGLSPKQVVIGTGSGELLHAISLAWGHRGKIVCPSLFFGGSVRYAERLGAKAVRVPLAEDMQIDLAGMSGEVDETTSMVQICNPNNPTGMMLPPVILKAMVRQVSPKATVLIDEAYNELTDHPDGNSLVDLVRNGEDVIVTRTFSKIYGMAGLRVGYALTSEANASLISSALMNGVCSTSGLAAAIASYNDEAFLRFSRAKIIEGREMIEDAVRAAGLRSLPSQTNFVFVEVPNADAMRDAMRKRGIHIRGAYDGWPEFSRVSAGKLEDIARYAKALPEVMNEISQS